MSQPGARAMGRSTATPEALSHLIVQLRHEQGLTQKALADRMGMRQATISKLEREPRASRVDTLYRALTALGVELAVVERPTPDAGDTLW